MEYVTFQELINIFMSALKILFDKTTIAAGIIISGVFYATGGKDNLIFCLFGVMIIDYITGVIKSIFQETTNSKIGFKGILKKISMLCAVALAVLLDIILETKNFKYNCRYLVICFYFANEGLSILENLVNAGLPVPNQLKNILEQCKKRKIKRKE